MGVGSGVVLGRGQDVAIPALRATCHLEGIVEVVEIYKNKVELFILQCTHDLLTLGASRHLLSRRAHSK